MNYVITVGNQARQGMLEDNVNFSNDSFNCLLMREDFSFSASKHQYKRNVSSTDSHTWSSVASTKTITITTGSFVDQGIVSGNWIYTNTTTNPGPFSVNTVAALSMTVNTISGEAALEDEGPVTSNISNIDEYATGGGYTRDNPNATVTFTAEDGKLYLDAVDPSYFGESNMTISPGIVVYDHDDPEQRVVLYAKFQRLLVNI